MSAPQTLAGGAAAPLPARRSRRRAPHAAAAATAATAAAAPPSPTLWIGNKKYSSWSLRPWLYLKHHGIAFAEQLVPLGEERARLAHLGGVSPTGRVPVLVDAARDALVWDSLAILEYINGAPPLCTACAAV
jgi:hypothetical protein